MIEKIKQALDTSTGKGDWNIGKASPNGLQNVGHKGLMICQAFEEADAHLIANAPEWLRYLISEVERLTPHPVVCGKGYCKSPADDYVGMFMSNEECPACNAHHRQIVKENEELQKALEWYAGSDKFGQRARTALQSIQGGNTHET
jgi:hypothetical protein